MAESARFPIRAGFDADNFGVTPSTPPAVIPKPGATLRALVTATGYRSLLKEARLGQDLDDAARECRPGRNAELLDVLERRFLAEFEADGGPAWGEFAAFLWRGTTNSLRYLATHLDTTCLPGESAAGELETRFVMPALHHCLHGAASVVPGLPMDRWWVDPFGSWVDGMCDETGLDRNRLLDGMAIAFEVEPGTLCRCLDGKPTRSFRAPYRPRLAEAIRIADGSIPTESTLQRLTGWLAAAVGCLSLPPTLRGRLQESRTSEPDPHWSLDETVRALGALGYDRLDAHATVKMSERMRGLESAVSNGNVSLAMLSELVTLFESLTADADAAFVHARGLMEGRLKAWQAILSEDDDRACTLLDDLIERAEWRAGWQQRPLLNDALLHAAGIGDGVRIKHIADRLRLLGDTCEFGSCGDAMDRRRLAMAFEKRFPPRKAHERVPPKIEVMDMSSSLALTDKHLNSPDRLEKFADSRTRRYRLMTAIQRGTLEDVERLLAAGADPNRYVPESGESALTYALRRAIDRRDVGPLNRLLSCELSDETANRPASTTRETPLMLAIDLDSADVVDRLLDLGAVLEPPEGENDLPLCRALARLQFARQGFDADMKTAWLEGHQPDGIDAKHSGAVSREDVARGHREFLAAVQHFPRKAAILKEFLSHAAPDPTGCRALIDVLLTRGANPNRTFHLPDAPLAVWTPTLHAAQVGDLDAFVRLLDGGGDAARTLRPATAFERWDALHLAVTHGHRAIVRYLRDRDSR